MIPCEKEKMRGVILILNAGSTRPVRELHLEPTKRVVGILGEGGNKKSLVMKIPTIENGRIHTFWSRELVSSSKSH